MDRRGADECWEWQARRHKQGYGLLSEWDGERRSRLLAHRVSWELAFGQIPDRLHVLHRCDNPPCVNPRHLFLGSQRDNNADKVAKGRQPRGESHPHSRLTEHDVRAIRDRARRGERRLLIAESFGISDTHVYAIINRRYWASVS
ncbi:MAG TPA: HNH endonuclease signature motif containing protein [Solirubrobacterales bacterium]